MITLIGTVTTFIEMNDQGEVVSVTVDDETHTYTGVGVRDGKPLSKKQTEAAIAQAEANASWPAWKFGW